MLKKLIYVEKKIDTADLANTGLEESTFAYRNVIFLALN